MEIAEQLQCEAEYRAGSPEGFRTLLALIFQGEPEPSEYLIAFRNYVDVMRRKASINQQISSFGWTLKNKGYSEWSPGGDAVLREEEYELSKAGAAILNTLPRHVRKQIIKVESIGHINPRYGYERIYLPTHFEDSGHDSIAELEEYIRDTTDNLQLPIPPFEYTLSALANAFGDIQSRDVCVEEVGIHPNDVDSFLNLFGTNVSLETHASLPHVVCYLWGARVVEDPTVIRSHDHRLRLSSETLSPVWI